jgi:hypothetical protein
MHTPSHGELIRWWQQEQEFYDTPLGRLVHNLKLQAYHLQKENEQYRQLILDVEERSCHPSVITNPTNSPKFS